MKNNSNNQTSLFTLVSNFPSVNTPCALCSSYVDLQNVLSKLPGEEFFQFRVLCDTCRADPKIILRYL
ncbi:hypothetical protein ES705_16762 [subsurface metagenome]|jgi:hypothetical protein